MSAPGYVRWIDRTGQRGKALGMLAVSCLAPGIAVLAMSFGHGAAAAALLALAVVSFVAFAMTIRCPSCRKSISWMVISTRPSARWLGDLFALEECPACDR
jgi:hypothetical protein